MPTAPLASLVLVVVPTAVPRHRSIAQAPSSRYLLVVKQLRSLLSTSPLHQIIGHG